jgi:outer membrane immunogenic protein
MMRATIIVSLVAASLAVITAAAAEPLSQPTYKAPLSQPTYNWAGFYVGGNAGGAWGSFDPTTSTYLVPGDEFTTTSIAAFNTAGMQSIKPDGFTGGFEAGYNWQSNNFVYGLEGDIEAFRLRGSASSGPVVYPCCAPFTFTINSSASTTWLATARARLGFTSGNWLFFATGGAAFTNLNGNFSFSDNFFGATEAASISTTKTGYTLGGGLETSLSRQWSVKAEYLYVDFGTVSTSGIGGVGIIFPTQPFFHSIDLKANIARLGLNYHF